MNRTDLQKLSSIRIREARVLLGQNEPAGAYYLAGYAVECALKACIAEQTRRYDFPDLPLARKAYQHDLEQLLGLADLQLDFQKALQSNKKLRVNWSMVKDWSESARYDHGINALTARDFLSACTARASGVLPWIRKRW